MAVFVTVGFVVVEYKVTALVLVTCGFVLVIVTHDVLWVVQLALDLLVVLVVVATDVDA